MCTEQVFGAILDTDTVDEEVTKRVSSALKNLQQPPYAQISTAAFQQLGPEEQAKISQAMAA